MTKAWCACPAMSPTRSPRPGSSSRSWRRSCWRRSRRARRCAAPIRPTRRCAPSSTPGRRAASKVAGANAIDTVLFDLGAVLIDWNPRYLYRAHFAGDEAAMEHFLTEIVPNEWNRSIDAGKTFDEAVAERIKLHPTHADLIRLWRDGWPKMLADAIPGTVAILEELKANGSRLYALTNWSAETFPIARERFDFLNHFEDIVVSGEVKLAKPDPRIFALTIERCRLQPAHTVFIDDSLHNVEAGRQAGLHALQLHNPDGLRRNLAKLGLLEQSP